MIGDAKQRPQRVHAAQGIFTLHRGNSPRPGENHTGRDVGRIGFCVANDFQKRPPSSCSKKRPMRVATSSVVRMNSASNMIAKWLPKLSSRWRRDELAEDVRHADGQSGCPGTRQHGLLTMALASVLMSFAVTGKIPG